MKQQIGDGGEALKGDIFERGGLAAKSARDFAAGGIAMRVQDAVAAVRAFAREQEARSFAIEAVPQSMSCSMAAGASSTSVRTAVRVAEAVAGDESVLLVKLDFIVIVERDGDAALRVLGRGFAQAVFGDDNTGRPRRVRWRREGRRRLRRPQ